MLYPVGKICLGQLNILYVSFVNHKLRCGYAMRHYGVNEKSITQDENTYLLDAYYGALFTDTMLTLFCMIHGDSHSVNVITLHYNSSFC